LGGYVAIFHSKGFVELDRICQFVRLKLYRFRARNELCLLGTSWEFSPKASAVALLSSPSAFYKFLPVKEPKFRRFVFKALDVVSKLSAIYCKIIRADLIAKQASIASLSILSIHAGDNVASELRLP
jgi:hypothetical protein